MEYRDYYGTLGVGRDATPADLKKAFRKLARRHHPDVNKGDDAAERRFKEVNEAYDVLSDPGKRKLYDQLGTDWDAYQRGGAPGADPFGAFRGAPGSPGGIRFEYHGDAEDLSGFSDFFRAFFAGGATDGAAGGSRSRPQQHAHRHRPRRPHQRSGRGAPSGAGRVALARPDPRRHASTRAAATRSPGCASSTRTRPVPGASSLEANTEVTLQEVATGTQRVIQVGERRLEVRIPPGVADGQRIRLPRTATPHTADATLIVRVRRDPVFTPKVRTCRARSA